jgi:hypothetical protein
MEILQILLVVLQGASISLGMGASTIAIANFFVAIADGKIDPDERKMMGVVYVVLRVAMILILLTTSALFLFIAGGFNTISDLLVFQALVTSVLFLNAWLMTKHIMPSSIGPALQAGSWYTLGFTSALISQTERTLDTIGMMLWLYIFIVLLALILVNGIMKYLKK